MNKLFPHSSLIHDEAHLLLYLCTTNITQYINTTDTPCFKTGYSLSILETGTLSEFGPDGICRSTSLIEQEVNLLAFLSFLCFQYDQINSQHLQQPQLNHLMLQKLDISSTKLFAFLVFLLQEIDLHLHVHTSIDPV